MISSVELCNETGNDSSKNAYTRPPRNSLSGSEDSFDTEPRWSIGDGLLASSKVSVTISIKFSTVAWTSGI